MLWAIQQDGSPETGSEARGIKDLKCSKDLRCTLGIIEEIFVVHRGQLFFTGPDPERLRKKKRMETNKLKFRAV